jgi:hypothetical protein
MNLLENRKKHGLYVCGSECLQSADGARSWITIWYGSLIYTSTKSKEYLFPSAAGMLFGWGMLLMYNFNKG